MVELNLSNDKIEMIALATIITGLAVLFFFILDYEPANAFYGAEDDNSFLAGTLIGKRHYDSGYTSMTVYACQEFNALYYGNISKETNETIYLKGSFIEKTFYVDFIR